MGPKKNIEGGKHVDQKTKNKKNREGGKEGGGKP